MHIDVGRALNWSTLLGELTAESEQHLVVFG